MYKDTTRLAEYLEYNTYKNKVQSIMLSILPKGKERNNWENKLNKTIEKGETPIASRLKCIEEEIIDLLPYYERYCVLLMKRGTHINDARGDIRRLIDKLFTAKLNAIDGYINRSLITKQLSDHTDKVKANNLTDKIMECSSDLRQRGYCKPVM